MESNFEQHVIERAVLVGLNADNVNWCAGLQTVIDELCRLFRGVEII